MPRQLDWALRPIGHRVTVGIGMIQERGIVEESVLVQKVEKVFTNFARWRTISFWGLPDRVPERLEASLHLLDFFF